MPDQFRRDVERIMKGLPDEPDLPTAQMSAEQAADPRPGADRRGKVPKSPKTRRRPVKRGS